MVARILGLKVADSLGKAFHLGYASQHGLILLKKLKLMGDNFHYRILPFQESRGNRVNTLARVLLVASLGSAW